MFNKNYGIRQKEANLANPISIKGINTQLDVHQATIISDVPITGGEVSVFIKTTPKSEPEPLMQGGSPYVMTLVANGIRTFLIPTGSISELILTPTVPIVAAGATYWGVEGISGMNK